MANITVKNIPGDLYERLKTVAAKNRRSINNEIIICIEKAIRSRRLNKDQFLIGIQKLRREIDTLYLVDEELNRIKNEGRV